MQNKKAILAVQDPPYNVDINDEFGNLPLDRYINWSERWVDNTIDILDKNSSLYIWLGADIIDVLQPLPDFIIMMRNKPVSIRNFITMRNQRGYGTQKNWMAIRQELLYYIKGAPIFNVQAEYTDIPKKTKGQPKGKEHANGIEGFWSYAKHWLYQHRGVPRQYFPLYLKEIEWRFNHRTENLIPLLKQLVKDHR